MSDLIKMLKAKMLDVENARGPAKHILNDRLADLGQVAWDYSDEIIFALKTVRGIEGLAKDGFVRIETMPSGRMYVAFSENLLSVRPKGVAGKTLSLAVDAAVGASEEGEK